MGGERGAGKGRVGCRALTEVPAVEAMELLLSKMRKTPDNIAFLMALDLK